ncbi:MAG: hypothetical protein J6B20_01465 [Clostridia bacterium]|nr:hypothetical protein [Clostridia bacterium]
MAGWLASVVGVVIIGVVVELLTHGRRMANFVRSIYGFIVLYVIVSPLPNLLKAEWWQTEVEQMIDVGVVADLQQSSKKFRVQQILQTQGYQHAMITMVDDVVYVNLGEVVDGDRLAELQKVLGEGVVII